MTGNGDNLTVNRISSGGSTHRTYDEPPKSLKKPVSYNINFANWNKKPNVAASDWEKWALKNWASMQGYHQGAGNV